MNQPEKLSDSDREKLITVAKQIGDLHKSFPEVKTAAAQNLLLDARKLLNKTNEHMLKLIINLK